MQLTVLIVILAILFIAGGIAIWLVLRPKHPNTAAKGDGGKQGTDHQASEQAVEKDIEHIFNDEFREELRNRGRLHFEKIIGENAMFLQQDLQLTTSQLNDYMKSEITRTLQEEFAKYEQSITDAKQLALESINKTREAIEQQREILGKQLQEQVEAEKSRLIERFEKNMADIVNHYVLDSIGNQIDLTDQLEYIIGDLEANKKAILDDIEKGT